jgi:hypothetical protein
MLMEDMFDMALAHVIITFITVLVLSPFIYVAWKARKKCPECARLNGLTAGKSSSRLLEMCKVKL